jgi:ABC-type branched-subunit amino acid transport system ATPase component
MAPDARSAATRGGGPILEIERLDVYYGRAHALQQVSLVLERGVLAVVGRNGMGKTTLCNAITGLVPATGRVRLAGEDILGLSPNRITRRGIGYVPQGRRIWPSLTVDEHLRLVRRAGRAPWTIARIYELFPRLANRRHHGGAQLSGGEQQMLAIGRALLLNPRLLVMDEPSEGLAPIVVEQVTATLKSLAGEGEIAVLLVEQNLGVAIDVADAVAVMVNGRIACTMSAAELGANRELQQQLLGVRTAGDDEAEDAVDPVDHRAVAASADGETRIYTIKRSGDETTVSAPADGGRAIRGFTRWNAADPAARVADRPLGRPGPRDTLLDGQARTPAPAPSFAAASTALSASSRAARVLEFPVAATALRAAYVAGTFDTKGRELFYLRDCL